MKIQDSPVIGNAAEKLLSDSKNRKTSGNHEFGRVFNGFAQENAYNNLVNMITEIDKQGKLLAERLNIAELRYYRKMIADFLQQAVCSSYLFEKETTSDNRGRMRKYSIVKKINNNIDDLMQKILKDESSHIEVMKMIDDIRGLLLDLAM